MIQHNQSIKSSKNGYRCDAEPYFAFWHHFLGEFPSLPTMRCFATRRVRSDGPSSRCS